jgi:GntR family transcriptional regulator
VQFRVHELKHQVVPSTPLIRERLNTDAPFVLLVEQVALFDGEPLYLRSSYHCARDDPWQLSRVIKELDDTDPMPALQECFERVYEAPFGGSWTAFEAVGCERRTAEILGVTEGSAVLLREMIFLDAAGKPRELTFTHYRSDRIVIEGVTSPVGPDRELR